MEITTEDLEFNLEKHRNCEYSENIYEFLFQYEKGNNRVFFTIKNNKPKLGLSKLKKTSFEVKDSAISPNSFTDRFSVCLKLPEKKNAFNSTEHNGSNAISPEKVSLNNGNRLKSLFKTSQKLWFLEKPKKISPYSSLSPMVKRVNIRSPKRQTKTIVKNNYIR